MRHCSARAIDGREIAEDLLADVATLRHRLDSGGLEPGLAVLLVGDDYAAKAYEKRIRSVAGTRDVYYRQETLPAGTPEADALAPVGSLNADPRITGILILRPLPETIREERLYRLLDPGKDIQCVHPVNAGLLALGEPRFVPSTPAAVFTVLDRHLVANGRNQMSFYENSTIVLAGRSNNVEKPALWLGLHRGASVISCDHRAYRAGTLANLTRRADVVIVATGVPRLIGVDHLRRGAIVLDVSINPVPSGRADGRKRLVGYVNTDAIVDHVEAYTPVPGGVGPVTDVCLLRNTMIATRLRSHSETRDTATQTWPCADGVHP